MKKILLIFCVFISFLKINAAVKQVPITIENNVEGAPVQLGIPFPIGELKSVDQVRLLHNGKEIPIQTTEVTTWEPRDSGVKWMWIFFFSKETSNYTLEYGKDIHPQGYSEAIVSTNNMRPSGGITVNTGPLKFTLKKKGNGFIDEVFIDKNNDQVFSENELIASSPKDKRGTFLDILDEQGLDLSNAIIHNVFREKGSGPLHTIFKVQGTYIYQNDNNNSPFEIRIHAYAGRAFIKVLHTLTYTGIPDKHKIMEGEHANIATQNDVILSEETKEDEGWTMPNDQIAGSGLTFKYHLQENINITTSTSDGKWYEQESSASLINLKGDQTNKIRILQTGPQQNNKDRTSTPSKRIDGFSARLIKGTETLKESQKANGWISISDSVQGISFGIKNFLKEYPKELQFDPKNKTLNGFIWPSDIQPKSFERKHTKLDGGMLGNFAQGITKTTEFIYYFHEMIEDKEIEKVMSYSLKSPVAHASPKWYTNSKVYGNMAPFSKSHPELENALQYKFDWFSFNQMWEPWLGIFDYGDGKNYYFNDEWHQWNNNEPTVDFQLWTNFMRTGNPKYYYMAQAMSKHTMDVDNVHWPKKRNYVGEINDAIDFWNYQDEPESTPYLGIGRRHAEEHWYALLSAHVWIQGWIASYYITGDNRALEVAKMTGDTYINRIWGEHDLRGRRLYLSVLNLVELYDATKSRKYKKELDERVEIMLELQKEQGGNLLLDRYGYSQTYVAQGLYKYYQLTKDVRIKKALIDHARWVRKIPPLNHKMESYLASIYPLLIGYEFTGEQIYLMEAKNRAKILKVGKLKIKPEDFKTQKELSDALLEVSNLPKNKEDGFTNWEVNQGLRVFGWTHANNIPYLLYWLEAENEQEK